MLNAKNVFRDIIETISSKKIGNRKRKRIRNKLHGFYMHYDSFEEDVMKHIQKYSPNAKIIDIDNDIEILLSFEEKEQFERMETESERTYENISIPFKCKYLNMILNFFGDKIPLFCVISHDLHLFDYVDINKQNIHCICPNFEYFNSTNNTPYSKHSRDTFLSSTSVEERIMYNDDADLDKLIKRILKNKDEKKSKCCCVPL